MKYVKLFEDFISEKLVLKDYSEYIKLVAKSYMDAPDYDPKAAKYWKNLNKSNYDWFKRLTTKVDVIFVTDNKSDVGSIKIFKEHPIIYLEGGQPYNTQREMKQDVERNKVLQISLDYSDHPILGVKDNIVFRSVHDYIVHILGNHSFSGKGEIASYNLHAKLAPKEVLPALFTEVVGQASFFLTYGYFPKQKIAVLDGFDLENVGHVKGYNIQNKMLLPKEIF
jgi:hypothetical protein